MLSPRHPSSARGLVADWPAGGGLQPQLEGRVLPAVGGFRLLRQIGEGRRAVVWLAQDGERGGEAVLKLARRRGPGGSPFAREFEIGSRLRHPHVVRMLEHASAGGTAYLAMEYVQGGDLAQRLRGALAPAEAVALLRGAAAGLAQLHRAGLVHRDVKPANFLLRADGALVLADLGLAAQAGECAPPAAQPTIIGTPRYVAPEQLQGAPARPAADVYSLGVLFHQMLCGRPPFAGETLMEVLSQQLVATAPPLPASCAGLQALCDAMLAKEAARRLPDADAVLERLAAAATADFLPAPAGSSGKRWTT